MKNILRFTFHFSLFILFPLFTFHFSPLATPALAGPPPQKQLFIKNQDGTYSPVDNATIRSGGEAEFDNVTARNKVEAQTFKATGSGTGSPVVWSYNSGTGAYECNTAIGAPSIDADAIRTPLPSVKGYPDTSTLRNSSDVPVMQYTPQSLTTNADVPVLSEYIYKTANYTIPSNKAYNLIYSNYGATGAVTFTLPTAVPGMNLMFVNETGIGAAGQVINIDPASTDRIYYSVSGDLDAQTVICDTAGDRLVSSADWGTSIILYCPAATRWIATNARQTWADGN